jgi:phage gpG-like protein
MIEGKVTGDVQVVAAVGQLSTTLRAILLDSIRRQAFRLQAEVVTDKLSGDPLHRRTGNLASSINVDVTDESDRIVARIGTKVGYGRVHEYGGTFQIPAHTRTLTTVFGRSVAARTIDVRAHTATFPERSFLRSTVREERTAVLSAIRADIEAVAKL